MHETAESLNGTRQTTPLDAALRAVGPAGREMSLIDVVLLACDVTEDETEVNDVVDGLIDRGAARLVPAHADEMFQQLPVTAADLAA